MDKNEKPLRPKLSKRMCIVERVNKSVYFFILFFLSANSLRAATLYVDINSQNPIPPFTTWATAATNIQDAIEAGANDDLVLVTNGVYASGGKIKFGDLTNRVALDKAVTVQSVNGPYYTTIRGAGATNSATAVRCAWITNGAALIGFTLTAGATRTSGDQTNLLSGGGVLCWSTNALVQNCLVISNVAQAYGGGVYQGVTANSALIGNRAGTSGSGAAYATLLNCTVVSNWQSSATFQSRHTNSIVYYNTPANYTAGTFAYSCITPSASGAGNIVAAPQLLPDAIHLSGSSPCRAGGTNLVAGFDIDGQTWDNPPSIGCDQWREVPIIIAQPRIQLTNNPIGFSISVGVAGQEPFTCYWNRNGSPVQNDGHFSFAQSTNLVAAGVSESDLGSYQVVISNAFGVVTSAVVNLSARFVNSSNSSPSAPYNSWANAAIKIQDAVDAAVVGEIVLVTNGIYRTGGKIMGGDLTNRVAIDKALIVQSVNGADFTVIEGNWNPTVTNGPTGVRCVWLTNGAAINGFTIRGGATRAVANPGNAQMFGGGIWASSTNAFVYDCFVTGNIAAFGGGAAYQVALVGCTVVSNRAIGSGFAGTGIAGAGEGGGAASSYLRNCIVKGNYADQGRGGGVINSRLLNCSLTENSSYLDGGGAYGSLLLNCTVVSNTASGYSGGYGAAVHSSTLTNCLVWNNLSRTAYPNTNYASSTMAYCLSSPVPSGVGNISLDPQLLSDGQHVAETSPTRAAGLNVVIGKDIDGQTWANPPAIGCDEWQPPVVMSLKPTYQTEVPSRELSFDIAVGGQSPIYFWFRNGAMLNDDAHQTNSSTANLKILKFGPEHAGDYYLVASNAFNVATSKVTRLTILCVDASANNPAPPYSTWATAATNIQTAVDASSNSDIILVTNGIYSTGGKILSGDLLNRVVIDKPVTVSSMNGYKHTIIEGVWDAKTNGPAAVRCLAMIEGSTLAGFTIRNGATRTNGNTITQQSGGGVWSFLSYTGASVINCFFTNNSAGHLGGGVYGGLVKGSIFVNNFGNIGGSSGGGGGAAAYSDLRNCTIYNNISSLSSFGAGVNGCRVYNSIVQGNYRGGLYAFENNYYPSFNPSFFAYSSSFPQPSGTSNTTFWPLFLDSDYHIPASSPARSLGSSIYSSGEDIDGEPWANPPSIGADEVIEANLTGPISLSVTTSETNVFVGLYHGLVLWTTITGRVSRIDWDFGDGVIITNQGSTSPIHWWTNTGTFTVTCKAYNAENPSGVSASIVINVLPLVSPSIHSAFISSNGFKFSFEAEQTGRYVIQYSTNLANPTVWQNLQTIFYSPGGTTQITDPAWTNSARFYRILVQ